LKKEIARELERERELGGYVARKDIPVGA